MEDYDKFLQHRLSQLRRNEEEEEEQLRPSASLIRFYGREILPPLLSRKQREEMQRYRDDMQKVAVRRKLSDDPRLANVLSRLHSIQLRKMPTLDELLQEPEITTRCLYSRSTTSDSVPQSDVSSGTKESLSPPAREENNRFCLPPLTSTTYSAFFNSDRTSQQTHHEGCLIDQLDSQQESQPSSFNGTSHQSLSSGSVTYVNVENSPSVSGRIDAESESPCFGSSQGLFNMGGVFHHDTSSTIAKMPDITSYPPVDGEELERSGSEEISLCSTVCEVKYISSTSFQEYSTPCDYIPAEKSESVHLDSAEHEDIISSAYCDTDEYVHENEESDNPDIWQTLSYHHTTEQHILQNSKEAEPADSQVEEKASMSSERPDRLSLQALLKKSQEYRWRQRMLRNQARNTKIQERTQEQPRARTEKQNLSDKENDEFPDRGTVTAESKKTKARRGTFTPSAEAWTKKSWDSDEMAEDEFISEKMNDASEVLMGQENVKELARCEEGTTFKHNRLNIPRKIITSHKQSSALIQQQPTAAELRKIHRAFHLTTRSTAFHKRPWKHRAVPVPKFCCSPPHFKSKDIIKTFHGGTSHEKSTFSTGLNKDHKAEGINQNNHIVAPSAVGPVIEGDVIQKGVLAKSSQSIDELESNLSVFKVVVSDLESTVRENLDNQCHAESNAQSESSFKSIEHSERTEDYQQTQSVQSDEEFWEDKLRYDGDEADLQECSRRQLFSTNQGMKEDENFEPERSFNDVEDILLMYREREAETVHELGGKDNETSQKPLKKTQHGGSKMQNPPAQSVSSVAWQTHAPDTFQTALCESSAPPGISLLSDTSEHHPVERKEEESAGARDSVCSPSLNKSYDVDTPSGLWLREALRSDMSCQDHLVQEEPLTSEGEEGASKVKRRLLMHVTEESPDNGRAAGGSAVRSSSLRAAVHSREASGAQKDKEEQLKELHAAQVRALQEEHRKQQEELQALAARCYLLQSVSLPCSMSSSRLGDTMTFSTLSKPTSLPSQHYRPLLAAAVKGFLTRRLLRTERVVQLARTIRDTQQFQQAFRSQLSPGRGFCSRQDFLLDERATLQLYAARSEVNKIFFSLSVSEQMQLISWDRELTRERKLRQQYDHPRRKTFLSAATQKSLERKRDALIQKKSAERNRVVRVNKRQKTGISPEQQPESRRGPLRANPQRVSKKSFTPMTLP